MFRSIFNSHALLKSINFHWLHHHIWIMHPIDNSGTNWHDNNELMFKFNGFPIRTYKFLVWLRLNGSDRVVTKHKLNRSYSY